MRILITGSRDWNDLGLIKTLLSGFPKGTTIIEGEARGADRLARQAAEELGLQVEPWPADWDRYGKRAGAIRNQQMVDSGADLCLAFPLPQSRGTFDCIERAEKAGILVIRGDEVDPEFLAFYSET